MKRIALALLAVAALPLFAQRYDDTVTVNVVEVPVYVDRFGVPVAGLTRDDFELFVDGQPQPVEYFDVIDTAQQASALPEEDRAEARSTDLNRRRLVVLLFDLGASSAYGLHRARKMATEFVNESPEGDAYAVAVSSRMGVRFVVPFTTDRVAVTRAIGTFSHSRASDPFHVATLEAERTAWGGGGDGVLRSPAFVDPFKAMRDWAADERMREDYLFVDDLASLADQLAPLSGLKRVVLLSERPSVNPRLAYDPAEGMREHYRAAGVVLDGIDVRLPRVPGGMANSHWADDSTPDLMLSGYLYSLAGATGGTVDASLSGLQKRNRVTYVLGFRPTPSEKRTRAIRVRLKDRGLFTEVRYRPSFTIDEPDPKDNWLFLADTLLNDIPQRGVTLDIAVEGTSVVATIPGVELLAYPEDRPLLLDVFFYVFDSAGQPAAWQHARVALDLARGRDFLSAHPYTVRQQFELPPGRYTAKTIVRVVGTDKTGFARMDFDSPEAGNGSAPVSLVSVD